MKLRSLACIGYLSLAVLAFPASSLAFRFVSWSDAQDSDWPTPNLPTTSKQAATTNPAFAIFTGDFQNDGYNLNMINQMVREMNGDTSGTTSNGMFNKTFLVRGNHDDHYSNSAASWQSYMAGLNKTLPAGVTNYVGLNSSSTYLTYSFDYENSRFIGADVPGDADLLTSTQISFIDARLTDAESRGLTHVFIYWHGPVYCVESTHCSCSTATGNCTPVAIVSLLNKHCINGKSVVSGFYHGHEHILGWTHLTSSRIPGLNCPVEQFMASPCGSADYNTYLFGYNNSTHTASRMDYVNSANELGFIATDVNGDSFTVNIYRVGSSAPILDWSKTFSKGTGPSVTPKPGTKPGDANGDNSVDDLDYIVWAKYYGLANATGPAQGDFNADRKTDDLDYVIWANNYLK